MQPMIAEIVERLQRGESLVLATTVTRNGSAPRMAGAQMLVLPDGSIRGTVGGGRLEAQVLELSAEVFRAGGAALREFQFSGKDAAQMDMICGGRQEVLVEYLDAQDEDLRALWAQVAEVIQERRRAWWISELPPKDGDTPPKSGDTPPKSGDTPPKDEGAASISHWLVRADGSISGVGAGELNIAVEGERVSLEHVGGYVALGAVRSPLVADLGERRCLIEPLGISGTLFIFGAGHVAQKLASVAKMVGFYTVVLDDRQEWANRARFETADEILVPPSMERAFEGLDVDEDGSIVIVTRGHLGDKVVLARAIETPAAYIGMIGSRRKRDLVYKELEREGVGREELARVHSPIGLPIGADTPEEIAVSIVAELIQERAKRIKGWGSAL